MKISKNARKKAKRALNSRKAGLPTSDLQNPSTSSSSQISGSSLNNHDLMLKQFRCLANNKDLHQMLQEKEIVIKDLQSKIENQKKTLHMTQINNKEKNDQLDDLKTKNNRELETNLRLMEELGHSETMIGNLEKEVQVCGLLVVKKSSMHMNLA